jgi:hypothetical protein
VAQIAQAASPKSAPPERSPHVRFRNHGNCFLRTCGTCSWCQRQPHGRLQQLPDANSPAKPDSKWWRWFHRRHFLWISGSDELWYDPASDATGVNRIFAVISDATDTLLQTVAVPDVNAHSIAVDPLNGDVFPPLEGSIVGGAQDTLCPRGCVAVFAQNIPEPS